MHPDIRVLCSCLILLYPAVGTKPKGSECSYLIISSYIHFKNHLLHACCITRFSSSYSIFYLCFLLQMLVSQSSQLTSFQFGKPREKKKIHLSEGFQHVWASCLTAWLRSWVHPLVYCCVSGVGYGKKRHRRGYAVIHSMVTGLFLCTEGRLDLPKAHVLRVRGKLFPKGKSRCCYQKEVDASWTTTQTHRCPLH